MKTKLLDRYKVPVVQKVITQTVNQRYEKYREDLTQSGEPTYPDYALLSKIIEKGLEYYEGRQACTN